MHKFCTCLMAIIDFFSVQKSMIELLHDWKNTYCCQTLVQLFRLYFTPVKTKLRARTTPFVLVTIINFQLFPNFNLGYWSLPLMTHVLLKYLFCSFLRTWFYSCYKTDFQNSRYHFMFTFYVLILTLYCFLIGGWLKLVHNYYIICFMFQNERPDGLGRVKEILVVAFITHVVMKISWQGGIPYRRVRLGGG